MSGTGPAAPRRYEALAYLLDRLARGEACPSYKDFARRLRCSDTFAKKLIGQLVREGLVAKTPGAQRALHIVDVGRARTLVVTHLHALGSSVAQASGPMLWGFPHGHLPLFPPFEHLPDP